MLKIERSDADVERIARCLLNHSECENVTDSYVMMIRDMPERWFRAIWPEATDEDIIEEFKEAFSITEMYELSPIDPEEDPYFYHAEWLRNSWLTKCVEIMLREGRVAAEDEEKISHMLNVIRKGKRRRCRYVREIIEDVD